MPETRVADAKVGHSARRSRRAVASRVRCEAFATAQTGAAETAAIDHRAPGDAVELLVRRKASLLADLERRLGSREDAEDLLQEALLRVVRKRQTLRAGERVTGWFHRVLQNLVVDCYRRRAASKRLTSRMRALGPEAVHSDGELLKQVCGCIHDVLATLRPAYAEILRRIELEEEPLRRVARELAITPGAASVRLYRARRALLEGLRRTCGACFEHSCLDCTCRRRRDRRDQ